MPVIIEGTVETGSVSGASYKRLFQSKETTNRRGTTVRAHSTNPGPIYVHVTRRGNASPGAVTEANCRYQVDPGQTYPLGAYADGRSDVYVGSLSGDSLEYSAWEVEES